MYNPYNPYSYPVMQQRLQSMEQQYPQMTPNYPQPQYQQQFLKGRAVTSLDEVKAAMIDLDGSVSIFPDITNKAIYTKQINLDGTASINVYKQVIPEENKEAYNTNPAFVEDISSIKAILIDLHTQIGELQKGAVNSEPIPNDATITKQPTFSEGATNGSRKK